MTSSFEILPAIDLRGGRVVRLEQGDFARETAFSADPAAVARSFADAGARWLHVVDLDGARAGAPRSGPMVAAIVAAVGDRVVVEVAGGLRTPDAVRDALDMGAARVIVGTAALDDPSFARRLVETHGPASIAAAIDVRGGRAVGRAWVAGEGGPVAADAIASLADAGVTTFEVTAIERDGTGTGPDLDLYRRLVDLDRGAIVASAGIASVGDITAVRAIGCVGAIVGRALYDGRLVLDDALAAATSRDPLAIRRREDGELLGAIRPGDGDDDRWFALTVFGGTLGHASSAAGARAIVERDGLGALARRWFYRSRTSGGWQVVLIQEAWPGRVRVVEGLYALPGVPTRTVTADDLAAGDVLTLDPPSEAALDQLRE
ncbi:MAG TPA: 1-(5-phosphoribosyl)-5-[(5-phosphoribosylamino)methylideneamino] imidazole-4-carboxamide isomerase [Candidatus Limnocylindrales bacterium]